MAKKSKRQSGPSLTYAERLAHGRPTVTFSLATSTVEEIVWLAERLNLSRSAVVTLAVNELRKRY